MVKGEHLVFQWDAGSEGMMWTEEGKPLQGFTGGGERTEWILPETMCDDNEYMFYIEMVCNGMFGNAPGGHSIQPPDLDKYYTLQTARIVYVNLAVRGLYVDFWIIGDASSLREATLVESSQSPNKEVLQPFWILTLEGLVSTFTSVEVWMDQTTQLPECVDNVLFVSPTVL